MSKGDLVTGSHSILVKWRKHFSHILNVHGIDEVWQTVIQTAELLALEPSTFYDEIATEKLKRCKSPNIEQIPTELIKAGGKKIHSETYVYGSQNKLCLNK
jgi:hypothetical protein